MKKKIEWNKVTWYSKALAGAIFVLLPLITFYVGVRLGFFMGATPPQVNIYLPSTATENYKTYANKEIGFSLEYPTGWRVYEYNDADTIASIKPKNFGDADGIKIYLQKNMYKDIHALKTAVDGRVGGGVDSWIRSSNKFDALVYEGVRGSAVMYVPINKDIILGITGPDNSVTLSILNSFVKL